MGVIINASPLTIIDHVASLGLLGVSESLGYEAAEIERHFHSYERWFETATTPSGEVHVADRVGSGNGAFQIDAGNLTWGAWLQILGSSDTPALSGSVKYDFHEVLIKTTERNATYFFQIGFGTTGAAALSAETYTEVVMQPISNQNDASPLIIKARRQDAATKAWARCMCPGQNTATLDFCFGLHEYEG